MSGIEKVLEDMEPGAALAEIAAAVKKLLAMTDDETRLDFVVSLIGEGGPDKVSSMVNL